MLTPKAVLIALTLAIVAGCGPIGVPPVHAPSITWAGMDERKNEIVYTYWVHHPNTTWHDVAGNYIFAKFVHHEWVPIYIGETASLDTEFRDNYRHVPKWWSCIEREGATHVHAHTSDGDCKFLPHLTVIPTTFDGDSYDT